MKQIEDYITSLVLSIKKEEQLRDCRFVKGFSAFEHENPLSGYMVAVSTLDTQFKDEFIGEDVNMGYKTSVVDATAKFRVYAPKNDGGDGLLTLSLLLSDAIKRYDTQNVCQDVKVSSISFDDDAMTVYRDVLAQLSFCLCEEVAK